MQKNNPIGILDSGVGGLTVLKEVQALLPGEDIIYFGDNKNVPYGNKTKEEVISLTKQALNFLLTKKVKLIGVGCNTITTILDQIRPEFSLQIIGVIEPVIAHLAAGSYKSLGLIATPFTIESQYYHTQISTTCGDIELTAEGCPTLAAYIDQGNFTKEGLLAETQSHINNIRKNKAVDTIILGCTHYPLITEYLKEFYPGYHFINPALYQALAIQKYLAENSLLSTTGTGSVNIYTTGDTAKYQQFTEMLNIKNIHTLNSLS
ncbi:MAG: glutamate racemase [Peptococcaceae bacterium]